MANINKTKGFCFSVAVAAMVFTLSCSSGEGEEGGGVSSSSLGGSSSSSVSIAVWLQSNTKNYIVTSNVADGVNYEIDYNYISYIDNKHYELQTLQTNTNGVSISNNFSRNGDTETRVQVFTDASSNVTTTTITTVDDEESGLILSQIFNATTTNYTVELLSTDGDVKTYKHYVTETGGMEAYSVYKRQNGVTLELKYYTAGDVLIYTYTTTFPDNAIIREKLPTLGSIISAGYLTYELLSDSATELKIRMKAYTAEDVLSSQQDYTYVKFNPAKP